MSTTLITEYIADELAHEGAELTLKPGNACGQLRVWEESATLAREIKMGLTPLERF